MIIISALDNSGQRHASDLVRLLRGKLRDEQFIGIGGQELAEAGCELIHDISDNSAMLTGVIGAMKWAIPAYRKLQKLMDTGKVKLVVLVDSPTFNLPLARAAKKRGIKTFYYIAPQTWAWAESRVKKIKARVDRLAVILPFEEAYFRRFGIDAHYVGHPFIYHVKQARIDAELDGRLKTIAAKRLLIMPGSRRGVVHQMLPAQLRIARSLAARLGPICVCVTAWPKLKDEICTIVREQGFEVSIDDLGAHDAVAVFTKQHPTLIANADLVLATSGTGTLEVAWHGRPMIIMYNASRLTYHLLGRWLIRTKHLSLINILAGRSLAPEFMPYIRDEANITETAEELLTRADRASSLGRNLRSLLTSLDADTNPAEHTAELILDLIKT